MGKVGRKPVKKYQEEHLQSVEKVKEIFHAKTDVELAKTLGVKPPQISQWRRNGFGGSLGKIIRQYQLLLKSE